ncbi:unnamed protein product [Protopolystoma xenopodis]|uniref:Uncharacterized protein n=1 Tax=Protopolystoma xenopodis TaxID=117903 RepID=A0A3S5CKK1_9PLAT|nr:unnamed protein product [Protopolystoma xenopodis]
MIEACKLGSRRLPLDPILYDTDHPLVGQAMKSVFLALKQIKNNRSKMQRRTEKLKTRNQDKKIRIEPLGLDVSLPG